MRAFANVCRHRGHEMLACGTTAKRRGVVCPYHSWSYKLTGELRHAPGFESGDGFQFDTGQFGLTELRLVDWHGYLFVDPSGADIDFERHVAGMEEIVGPYKPEELTVVARHSYELDTNWKVIVENYQECYHCHAIPPRALPDQPADQRGENIELPGDWMGGWMSMIDEAQTMSLSGRAAAWPSRACRSRNCAR